MSIKDNIDNTNTQKDKLKTGKRNIDNKLVELGGEEAVNLAEVPLKMQEMANQYSKVAEIITDIKINVGSYSGSAQKTLISLDNVNFTPKRVLVRYESAGNTANGIVDSKNNNSSTNRNKGGLSAYIANLTKDNFEIWAQRFLYEAEINYKIKSILLLG